MTLIQPPGPGTAAVLDLRLDGVTCLSASVGDFTAELRAAEHAAVRNAVPKRQREFSTGRWLARQLIAAATGQACDIPSAAGGRPVWPAGLVGSLAHSDTIAAAALANRRDIAALGIDIETAHRLTADLHTSVLTVRELRRCAQVDATLFFSAKEACYKLLNPLTGTFVEFPEIEIDIDLSAQSFSARYRGTHAANAIIERALGRFGKVSDHWFTAIALPGPTPG
ncbi:MAG: 4'-phosphopantetheinyl transferase superfamily protein [Gammaproteobacteria bacterium]|nr:4'-phosphopantetheinyl transferase superfamily protein [Gammaproteobacteria bacterium]